jgi:Mg-chelatase subunit ChlD
MNVYILLDRSGSMASLWDEAIGSINGYVEGLKKTDRVHLAAFDNVSHDIVRDVKVKDWKNVSPTELQPRGGTPLYDSCGKIMAQAELDNSKKTILVVMTDGWENASKEHTQESIKAKVKAFENRKWEVIFLGANFDSVETVSSSVGVMSTKTMNISAGNMMDSMTTLRGYTQSYSATGASINFSADDKLKASIKVDIK